MGSVHQMVSVTSVASLEVQPSLERDGCPVWVLETEVWSLYVGCARKSTTRRKENLMPPTTVEGTLICQRTQR